MRRLIIFAIACLFSQSIYAQQSLKDLNHPDRFILSEALLFLDDYAGDGFWNGKGAWGNMSKLINNDALIINDIPTANSQEMVSIDNYYLSLNTLISKGSLIQLYPYATEIIREYSNDIQEIKGKIIIDVKKQIVFKGESGNNYRDTLDQKFTLGFQVKKLKLKFEILSIISNSPKGKYIVADLITNGNNGEDFDLDFEQVVINNKDTTYNLDEHFGKVVFSDFTKESNITFHSSSNLYHTTKRIKGKSYEEVGSDGPSGQQNLFILNFRKKRFSLVPMVAYDFRNKIGSPTEMNSFVDQRLTQLNYGLSFGTRIVSKENRSITFNVGGGISYLDLITSISPFTSMFSQVDSDGDPYTRIVRIRSLEEVGSMTRSFIQSNLSFALRCQNTAFSIFSGLDYYYDGSYNYATEASAKYSGLYGSEYFNILIADPNHYLFGDYSVSLQDQALLNSEFNLVTGLSAIKDVNKRTQLSFSMAYSSVLNSPFNSEEILSIDLTEFKSVQQLENDLWKNRIRTSVSLIYYL